MNGTLKAMIFFVAGGVTGFMVANTCLKNKYEQRTREEIDSVKAALRRERKPIVKADKKETKDTKPTEEERKNYSRRISSLGYTTKVTPDPVQKPRIITPDEFGDNLEYDQISLTYYVGKEGDDKVLADDHDKAMSDDEIEETIGKESLNHFGEYEMDSVFVRNDRLKVDYEILIDDRSYADVLKDSPFLV